MSKGSSLNRTRSNHITGLLFKVKTNSLCYIDRNDPCDAQKVKKTRDTFIDKLKIHIVRNENTQEYQELSALDSIETDEYGVICK